MERADLEYVCNTMANLSGIPIRIYQGDQLLLWRSLVHLPKDPMLACKEELWKITDQVSYYVTPQFLYYGLVNFKETRIILGPTFHFASPKQIFHTLAFQIDVPPEETGEFIQGMSQINSMPLESLLQILCMLNYVISRRKVKMKDLVIHEEEQSQLRRASQEDHFREVAGDIMAPVILHNTYDLEQILLSIVRKGDSAALREWASSAPAVRPGTLAADTIRQLKNTVICTTTLVTRAAIRGGMDVEDAFSLSDTYIQRCEEINNQEKLINLQFHMIFDFTDRVERILMGGQNSKLAIQVSNYVQKHLSEHVNTETLAKHLYMNRTHLSARFHQETGITLCTFITLKKMEEAKRLLRYSDKSLTAISNYLGYSSLGHFSNVFKKHVGLPPTEYREKHS